MRSIIVLVLFIGVNGGAFANSPTCPLQESKNECLALVEQSYQQSLDYLLQEFEGNKDTMIEVARTIRHYEAVSCEKTCLNS